ncbi:hypothetical protein K4B79_23195 [Streptomyces lincolnensis]|uniref:hypothetical protein n=1 Tax=Streptomyces lincolnensis TaxID=1915 RepID=UPI001E40A303|nr:hypothetical protein [Streptomyces lincolnensis]MCD7441120.1 hypothetical protein [Streptomyces lincolnensis]
MRQKLSVRRPGVLVAPFVTCLALLLAGCGSDGTDDKSASGRPSEARTSASTAALSPGPDTTPDANDEVDEAFRAARSVALQSNLRYIDPALGTPEGLATADAKADAQCADLRRNIADPDRVAARRFSTGTHEVTVADGKRINTLLRNTYCAG